MKKAIGYTLLIGGYALLIAVIARNLTIPEVLMMIGGIALILAFGALLFWLLLSD